MKSLQFFWRAFMALFVLFFFSCSDDDSDSRINTGVGNIFQTQIYSPGLDGNLLGDNPHRAISVYLPPGYQSDTEKRYPVIYMLHRYNQDHLWLFGENDWKHSNDLRPILDELINDGVLQPMIIVAPDGKNHYGGSWFHNSPITGQWEDFVVQDVVDYMDKSFRTLPTAESRGIAGVYMGGHAAVRIAMHHPDIFGSLYGITPSALKASDMHYDDVIRFYALPAWEIHGILNWTTAFFPRPDIPEKYSEIWQDVNNERKQDVWDKAVRNQLLSLIDSNQTNLKKLVAIQIDCCMEFENVARAKTIEFSKRLEDLGIEHVHLQHEIAQEEPERIINHVLPFFSEHLVGE